MRKVAFHTFGCKVNQYETEAMKALFIKNGDVIVRDDEHADLYVINTCTVTSVSDKKSRQMIRRLKRQNENALVAVVGCYSQIAPHEVAEIEGVNLILGTDDRNKIVELIHELTVDSKESHVHDIKTVTDFEEMNVEQHQDRTRAYLKVQEGCNQFCSYCIIPFARGPIRSRKMDNVVEEVEKLCANGFKEVVLAGIHVASYGKDLEEGDLLDLIEKIAPTEGLKRIRLSSLAPALLTDRFIERTSALEKFCPHFHISIQSGSDTVLSRMNRKYTAAIYQERVEALRAAFHKPAITTDIIVGFPGETEAEFEETLETVRAIGFAKIHVFKYSKRKGTQAALYQNQVPEEIKSARSEKLIALGAAQSIIFRESFIGETFEVLFETYDDNYQTAKGHTMNYLEVEVPSLHAFNNEILKVQISGITTEGLKGTLKP
jgi:threonylcarbamoyladenosine tRNA methylthiotransferase MtaB